jgi:hypothetical protein
VTVAPTAWTRLDGAAATEAGCEAAGAAPDVAGAVCTGLAAGAELAGAAGAELASVPAGPELADGAEGAEVAEEAGAADGAELVAEVNGAELVDAGAELVDAGAEVADEAGAAGAELADGTELADEAAGAEPVDAGAGWVELAGAVELPCEAAEVTALTWDDAAGAAVWVTDEAAEPTAPSRPAEPVGELLPEGALEDADDGVVSAWAWRENRTRMARIPVTSSTACIARRAM